MRPHPITCPPRGTARRGWPASVVVALSLLVGACAAPAPPPVAATLDWTAVQQQARGQTVSLWMYGGDEQGNRYVDTVLTPAAAAEGVTLRRVPVAATADALNKVLTERQAGVTDGSVDLVWINGDNFATGRQAGAWLCGWPSQLPHAALLDPDDPLLGSDFGTPVEDCESPWHKAQFSLVYNADAVPDPPTTVAGVLDWARAHPGRFTYPAPPDFTGSVFVREVLSSVSGGPDQVPVAFDEAAYERLSPALYARLNALAPSLWRRGETYPQTSAALNRLYASGEVDLTMTYGPATLTELVADGTYPAGTRVLALEDGTVGNASFLAIPSTSGHAAGAQVVADLALSAPQQIAKARPQVWGQFPAVDPDRLSPADRTALAAAGRSAVVPSYEQLSRNAHAELSAAWVPALDQGWRRTVLAAP